MTQEEVFAQLGFNTLEAEVYICLLKNGPQTAYRIGKLTGKPSANVYKAVEVLAREGAVELTEADVRICKAIPIQTVVKQLQSAYQSKISKAVDALKDIQEEKQDEGIYKLQTVESVLQRAKEMLSRVEVIAVVDAFPNALKEVTADVNRLAKEKKEVFVQAYLPVKLDPRVSLVVPGLGPDTLRYWDAQQLNIAVDGKEILLALFNRDMTKLIQATYSNNLYLSCMMYSGIINEHKVHRFSMARTMKEINEIKDKQKFFFNSKVPGLELLFSQYKKKQED